MSEKEERKMHEYIIKALGDHATTIQNLKKSIENNKDNEWNFDSNTLKIAVDDLETNSEICIRLSNDLKDIVYSNLDNSQLYDLIYENEKLIRLSLESYIKNLEEMKSKILHKLACSDIKLEKIDQEIEFINKLKQKFLK